MRLNGISEDGIRRIARKVIATSLKPVDNSQVEKHLMDTDVQYPHPDEVEDYTWKRGMVSLDDIIVTPSSSVSFRASDANMIEKVRESYDGGDDDVDRVLELIDSFGGSPFTAIVLSGMEGVPTYSVMDGFHRIAAANVRGDKEIDAFVGFI